MRSIHRRASGLVRAAAATFILVGMLAALAAPAVADEFAGWEFQLLKCENEIGLAVAQLGAGPGMTPLGGGSLQFALAYDGKGFPQVRQSGYDGFRVDAITTLSYETYISMTRPQSLVPYLILDVDVNRDGVADDQLIFQPGLQSTIINNNWQSWDALNGAWYSVQGRAGMTAAVPRPLTTYLTVYPDATIVSPDGRGGLRIAAGCIGDDWSSFEGAVDAFAIGFNDREPTVYDFEAGRIEIESDKPGSQPGAPAIELERLMPTPFSTAQPGEITIGAELRAQRAIRSVSLTINGTVLPAKLTAHSDGRVVATAVQSLTAGNYNVVLTVTDVNGQRVTAQWDFVISGVVGESEWFRASGAPKADEINATLRSLVEAFRWHLYGQSWDGQPHPEMPTHADVVTQAPPVETFVSGTTFNREATEATLRSLVESFRWHFWGISWDGQAHPEVPTHANDVLPPEPIDPWFNADGSPNRVNIEATMRSLVEAFRWHFWGHSWDGQPHHDEMPTHAE